MPFRLFVGNLPYSATEEDMRNLFEEVGTVESVTLVTDRATGQPRGFGFVNMATREDARRAISTLNGTSFRHRPLTVNEARPPAPRAGFGGAARAPRHGPRR